MIKLQVQIASQTTDQLRSMPGRRRTEVRKSRFEILECAELNEKKIKKKKKKFPAFALFSWKEALFSLRCDLPCSADEDVDTDMKYSCTYYTGPYLLSVSIPLLFSKSSSRLSVSQSVSQSIKPTNQPINQQV